MSDETKLNPEETQKETKRTATVTDEPSVETLKATLTKYGIEISEPQIELLEKFCELEWDWNTKINLTRHTTYEKFVTRDLVDTLAFSEFLAPNEKVLDVGSGNGVPGILLGILRPDVSISLVECVAKKAKVLAEIIHELQLPIPVYCALGQDILGNWQFHTLTFRAVASMKKILEWFKPCWPHFDRMLLVKGPKWTVERGEARHYSLMHGLALRKLKEYTTPGSDEGNHSPEEAETSPTENPTEQENGAKSVILQICPEEKIGKGNLCVLSSLETSKSRNKFDHDKRRKSRVVEETVEYVDAADFDGLDEDGDQVSVLKNAPRRPFGSKSERSGQDRGEKRKRTNQGPGFGGRGGGLESGFRSERKKSRGPKKFRRDSED
ncbi:MAG: 16S rRNA (guanine(527)-N(7))-methyltransferase RsmG [Thermoguttaceae bacterium]